MKNKDYVPLVRLTMVKEKELPYGVKRINEPELVAELAGQILKDADREYLLVISVDARSKPLAVEIVSIGTVNASLAEPREIFKHSILNNAAGIILVHNHPSGIVTPSKADIEITKRIREAGEAVSIRLFDHLIISKSSVYSFHNEGFV